jgi:Nuclease-related domain
MPRLIIPNVPPDGLPVSTMNTVKDLIKNGRQVFGSPAASLTWGIDGTEDGDVSAGIEGEKMTAKILAPWLKANPCAILVHSVRWPGSNGDSDHMLIIGNKVILIDSKRWKSKRKYSVTPTGSIKRGTVDFPEGKVKMIPALQAWRGVLPKYTKISGVVCVAQDEVFVPYDANWYKAPYRLVTGENLTTYLDEFIQKSKEEEVNLVNLGLITSIIARSIKPRDRRAEVINSKALKRR